MITIIKHNLAGCKWCKKWDKDEKPYLNTAYEFEEVIGGAEVFPSFTINVNGEIAKLGGYVSIRKIEETIERLKNVPS